MHLPLVRSHLEDIVYSLFSAERDEDSNSPGGAFDGIYTKMDMLITRGDVNAAVVISLFPESLPRQRQIQIIQLTRIWWNGSEAQTPTFVLQ